MKKFEKSVIVIAVVIILITIGLDQYTKWLATTSLATTHFGGFEHRIELVVPPNENGKTLHQFIESEFGSSNTPEEIQRIESSTTVNGESVPATQVLETGENLAIGWREVTVIPDYWDFQYTRNNGAAFSFLADTDSPWRTPFFIGISLLSVIVILIILGNVTIHQKLLLFGLALICGGAIGNLIDRILYGYVIDFIVWKYTNQYRWPTFNVADSAICVGIGLLAIQMIIDAFHPSEKGDKSELEFDDSDTKSKGKKGEEGDEETP